MTCTQNHKSPEECIRSDCAPIFAHSHDDKTAVCPICIGIESYKHHRDIYQVWHQRDKKTFFPWKESYQWLKIVGLSIALGVMVYQTYLLKIIANGR